MICNFFFIRENPSPAVWMHVGKITLPVPYFLASEVAFLASEASAWNSFAASGVLSRCALLRALFLFHMVALRSAVIFFARMQHIVRLQQEGHTAFWEGEYWLSRSLTFTTTWTGNQYYKNWWWGGGVDVRKKAFTCCFVWSRTVGKANSFESEAEVQSEARKINYMNDLLASL